MAKNQCDGCARGLPLEDGLFHRGKRNDIIGCTAYLYDPRPKIQGLYVIPNDYAHPVYKERSKLNPSKWLYFFFDKMWDESHGPYDSEKECSDALNSYSDTL